jgi:RNA polymerase sigma-70 factor (ECF subfamily)
MWLWGIVRRTLSDNWRSSPRATESLPVSLPSAENVEAAGERSAELERVRRALAQLSLVDRELVALRFGAGLTNAETASVAQLSPGNTAVRLHRAIRRLRSILEGNPR